LCYSCHEILLGSSGILSHGPAREEKVATDGAREFAGWLWVGLFHVLVFVAGLALVGGGTVLATFGWGVLQNDVWHLVAGIALLMAGVAVFVGGVILLFRITSIEVPGRLPDNANARTGEYLGYTDAGTPTHSTHGHHHGGSHSGSHGGSHGDGAGGSN
jgi:hypothetical protein